MHWWHPLVWGLNILFVSKKWHQLPFSPKWSNNYVCEREKTVIDMKLNKYREIFGLLENTHPFLLYCLDIQARYIANLWFLCFPTGGPSKEWKPKPTNPNLAQGSGTVVSSEVLTVPVEANTQSHSQPTTNTLDSNESASELERKLGNSHISDSQHVIIPNHLHVPEVEKLGFCFGSFDASFGLNTPCTTGPESDKSQPLSETSEGIDEESTEEQSLRFVKICIITPRKERKFSIFYSILIPNKLFLAMAFDVPSTFIGIVKSK